MGQRPQNCLLVPILPGTDGVRKMSKSLGNYIGVDEPPADMYGKTMSLPDEMVDTFFELLTDMPDDEVASIKATIKAGTTNPMDLKKRLAQTLVATFHSEQDAARAQAHFERTVQAGQAPADVPDMALPSMADRAQKRLSAFLAEAGLAASGADAKRLIDQRAVSLNGNLLESNITTDGLTEGVLKVGKRQFVRLVEP